MAHDTHTITDSRNQLTGKTSLEDFFREKTEVHTLRARGRGRGPARAAASLYPECVGEERKAREREGGPLAQSKMRAMVQCVDRLRHPTRSLAFRVEKVGKTRACESFQVSCVRSCATDVIASLQNAVWRLDFRPQGPSKNHTHWLSPPTHNASIVRLSSLAATARERCPSSAQNP